MPNVSTPTGIIISYHKILMPLALEVDGCSKVRIKLNALNTSLDRKVTTRSFCDIHLAMHMAKVIVCV